MHKYVVPILGIIVLDSFHTAYTLSFSQNIAGIIVRRMHDPNPHKQWLTIVVAQRVLRDCKERMQGGKADLLLEVAHIAAKPIGTTVVNASAAQKSKQEAFSVLQEHGEAGIEAMREAGGPAAVNLLVNEQAVSANTFQQHAVYGGRHEAVVALQTAHFEEIKEAVNTNITMAKGQTEVLTDMVANFKKGNGNNDRGFFEDLAAQMVQLRYY